MYATELERIFSRLMLKTDFCGSDIQEVEARFGALRGSGHLPQGRALRGQRLTHNQIALAILGLVPRAPSWAGHSASCLRGLTPIGGPMASPWNSPNLLSALEKMLTDQSARDALVKLTMTGAESGVNCHGHAEITFLDHGQQRRSAFASPMAYSRQHPGAELTFEFDRRYAPTSREISFGASFFNKLSREFEQSLRIDRPPHGEGKEYDAEEALQAYYLDLGAGPNSRFLNVGVEATIQWPNAACKFEFGPATIVAMPPTKSTDASLHIDVGKYDLSDHEGWSFLSEALSVAVWVDDQAAILLDGWSGNPVPVAVPRSTHRSPSSIISSWCNGWGRVEDDQARRLLGLYRESRNLELTHSIPYAFLGYYRIFESLWPGKERAEMLANTLSAPLSDYDAELLNLDKEAPAQALADFMYAERHRVAHAKSDFHQNPDASDDIRRLSVAARILRKGARAAMVSQTILTENRWKDFD